MNGKPVIPREAATHDLEGAIDYYIGEGATDAAMGFIDAVEQAFRQIGRHAKAGSSRYAHELDLPGLRHSPVKSYPYLIFYHERDDHIDVWRVLHAQRDVPAWLGAAGP